MLRNILGLVAGLVVGMVANMALVMLNVALFPMPEGVSFEDPVAFGAYVSTLPAHAWIVPILAHLSQAFVGGWVAARIAASHPRKMAMVIGVFSLLGGIMNAINLSPPAWVYIEMPLYLAAAWAAGTMEINRRKG